MHKLKSNNSCKEIYFPEKIIRNKEDLCLMADLITAMVQKHDKHVPDTTSQDFKLSGSHIQKLCLHQFKLQIIPNDPANLILQNFQQYSFRWLRSDFEAKNRIKETFNIRIGRYFYIFIYPISNQQWGQICRFQRNIIKTNSLKISLLLVVLSYVNYLNNTDINSLI